MLPSFRGFLVSWVLMGKGEMETKVRGTLLLYPKNYTRFPEKKNLPYM